MNPRVPSARVLAPLLLALTLSGLACKAPAYDDLEKERPRLCNESHACADGYTCVDGTCQKGPPPATECQPDAQRACGVTRGECRQGTQTCGKDGTWGACVGEVKPTTEVCNGKDDDCDAAVDEDVVGASCALNLGVCANALQACVSGALEQLCTAASYGPDYEVAETRCDNKDNDCDGQVDEDLTQLCEKQRGVCEGAVSVCRGGAFASCDESSYRFKNSAYEVLELTCDGQDNDCDGTSDTWDARDVSGSAVATSRSPAVAALPGSGTSAVVLYEEDGKVLSRTLGPSGMSAPKPPSTTLQVANRASLPVVASDGKVTAAVWVEQVSDITRVMIALLGADGTSSLANGGATPIFDEFRNAVPTRLSLAVNNGRVAVAMEDSFDSRLPSIRLTALDIQDVGAASFKLAYTLTASAASTVNTHPHVSPAAKGGFNVAWEVVGKGITLATLDTGGALVRTAITGEGGSSARRPHVFTTLADGSTFLYFLAPWKDGQDALMAEDCTGDVCKPAEAFASAQGTAMDELVLVTPSVGEQPTLAVWSEAAETIAVRFSTRTAVVGATPDVLTPSGASGQRPAATLLGPVPSRTLLAAFDTDGGNGKGLTASEVFVRPACVPDAK